MLKRGPRAIVLASAIAIPLTIGTAIPAAATVESSTVTLERQDPITVTFNLLVPGTQVTFTVNGVVVGQGVTSNTGDVTFTYTPTDLPAGNYRLTASTPQGVSSSVAFGVR